MKKLLFYSAIVCTILLLFSGCNQSKKYQVTLNFENADGRTLFLCKTVEGTDVVVDSTVISGDGNDMPHWTVTGCPAMNELSAFHEKSAKLYEGRIMAIYAEMTQSDSAKVEELNAQLQPIIKEYFDYQVDFIKDHSDSYIGHFMLDQMKDRRFQSAFVLLKWMASMVRSSLCSAMSTRRGFPNRTAKAWKKSTLGSHYIVTFVLLRPEKTRKNRLKKYRYVWNCSIRGLSGGLPHSH